MSNSNKTPKKLTMKVGKRSLRTVPDTELDQIAGGMPADGPRCQESPPPKCY